MSAAVHRVEIQQLRSGAWGATCSCGWVPPISAAHEDVLRAAKSHTEDVTIVDGIEADAGAGARRHERQRAELIRGEGATLLFRAVCSCGWKSEPVTMGRAVVVWERHVDTEDGNDT